MHDPLILSEYGPIDPMIVRTCSPRPYDWQNMVPQTLWLLEHGPLDPIVQHTTGLYRDQEQ